jgi:hypothetical protein
MANKKIEVDIIIESEDSQQKLRELTKALKQLPAGTAEWKKVYSEIDDLKDRLKGAKKGTDDWVDSLENAGGPLGMVGAGINKMKVAFSSFNTALKASIIGLIVAAIGGLVAAFSQSEVAVKKLQPLMIGLERILGGIFRAMEPLLDVFIDLATRALPYITKGIGAFYSAIYGLFTFIKTTAVGVGEILKGIFTLDFDSVKQGYEKLSNVIGDTVKSAKDAFGRYETGTKELTKTEKEELEKRQKLNEEAQKKKDELAKQAEEERKKREEEARKAAEKAEEERKKNLEEANKVLNDAYVSSLSKRDQEIYRAGEELNKNLTALEKAGITDKTLVQEQYRLKLLEINNRFDEEEKKKKEEKEKKDRETLTKKLQDDLLLAQGNVSEQIRITGELQEQLKTNDDLSLTERYNLQKGYQDNLLSLLDTSYSNQKATIETNYDEFKRFDSQYYDDQRQALEKYGTDLKSAYEKGTITKEQFTARDKQLAQARKDINKQEVASNQEKTKLIGDALGQLSTIVGQDTTAGKAFAIAKATIDTYQSAVAAYKSLAGIPVIGPALGAIAAAAAVASGVATVKKIVAVQIPSAPANTGGNATQTTPAGPGERPIVSANATSPVGKAQGGLVRGGGGAFSDSIPAMLSDGEFVVNSRSAKIFQPLLTSINESGNLPGFAAGGAVSKSNRPQQDNTETLINAIQQSFGDTPIRTYVTANDISNQQQFDRTIKSRSLI